MLEKWKRRLWDVVRDVYAVWLAMRNPRVPWHAKATAAAALLYVVMPIDIIPDVIPIIGWLDDLAMVPLASYIASRLIPFDIMSELRRESERRLMRWGPKATYLVFGFILFWLILAGIGLWMWFGHNTTPPATVPVMPPLPTAP